MKTDRLKGVRALSAGNELRELTRLGFLKGTLATAAMLGAGSFSRISDAAAQSATASPASMWLGRHYWANRLQDWMLTGGRIECIAPAGRGTGRTVALLTSSLGDGPVTLKVRTGSLRPGAGFSGFLVGTGTLEADPRTAALVLSASGEGGGLYAVYDADGRVRFREHTDERNQFAYAELPSQRSGPAPPRRTGEDVELRLDIIPESGGSRMLLRAFAASTGSLLSKAELRDVHPASVRGGLSLVSSDSANSGARYWFRGLTASGSGVIRHPERAFGPVAGTLFSVSGSVLKMTVQMMPDASLTGREIVLDTREGGGTWSRRAAAPVGSGFTALIRVKDWDTSRAHDYRVVSPDGSSYAGTIPAEPRGGELVVGSINCFKTTHRGTDRASDGRPRLPGQRELGLYTSRNAYFPHDRLATNVASHEPDLLVAHGDQLYEGSPSLKDTSAAPELDFLYKYLFWLWSFRDLTRSTPTVVMVDDHDVYQGNIWGEGGAPATQGLGNGGYVNAAEWINVVQRVQCGHNPDPHDPRPVEQGISVYYAAFAYGGVSFAIVEDRKFKSGPDGRDAAGNPIPEENLVLLGQRQENFLRAWKDTHPGLPKIVLSQTPWACVSTDISGGPNNERDSNGWPPLARHRAVALVRDAGALMLAGDQHLSSLIRHGLEDHDDGPVQFTTPGGSTSWQRWFEPREPLPNDTGTPHTGDWIDAFGNRLRVLAVANPEFTQAEFRAAYPTGGNDFGDRDLKSEGYGIVRVDFGARRFTLECRRWDDATQYPGWPFELPFDQA